MSTPDKVPTSVDPNLITEDGEVVNTFSLASKMLNHLDNMNEHMYNKEIDPTERGKRMRTEEAALRDYIKLIGKLF